MAAGSKGLSAFSMAVAFADVEMIGLFFHFFAKQPDFLLFVDEAALKTAVKMLVAAHKHELSFIEYAATRQNFFELTMWLAIAEKFEDLADLLVPRRAEETWTALHYALAKEDFFLVNRLLRSLLANRFISSHHILLELTNLNLLNDDLRLRHYPSIARRIVLRVAMLNHVPTLRDVPGFLDFETLVPVETAILRLDVGVVKAMVIAGHGVDSSLLRALFRELQTQGKRKGFEVLKAAYDEFMKTLYALAEEGTLDGQALHTVRLILEVWQEWIGQGNPGPAAPAALAMVPVMAAVVTATVVHSMLPPPE
jgi:hypothetical protein